MQLYNKPGTQRRKPGMEKIQARADNSYRRSPGLPLRYSSNAIAAKPRTALIPKAAAARHSTQKMSTSLHDGCPLNGGTTAFPRVQRRSLARPSCETLAPFVHPHISASSALAQSITSSARSRIDGGMARPNALAVLRFTARRKIAPPPQRPLWRQSLCGLETRALALQRD